MPQGTKILTDVPEDRLAQVVKTFEEEGAKVTTAKQDNGKYTVTAVFPDATAKKSDGEKAKEAPKDKTSAGKAKDDGRKPNRGSHKAGK
jgi:hypothetical protein